MEKAFTQQTKHGIMGDDDHLLDEQEDDIGYLRSSSSSSSSSSAEEETLTLSNSVGSSSSDSMEDASSSASSSNGPLFEMSSLISQLPFKRGLSKHFEGKSQSFTSLANVQNLEDLIKPERPFKKRQLLKSSRSYGWGLDKSLSPKNSITKRSSSKGSFSSLGNMRRHSNSSFRPPCPTPQRPGSLSRQTLLETIG